VILRGPFAERSFRLLFLGRTASFAGTAIASVALAFAVLDLTGSKADLGYVLAARALPQVIFLLAGGIWADRLPRQHVISVANLVSGLSQATIAVLLFAGHAEITDIRTCECAGVPSGAVVRVAPVFFVCDSIRE